MDKVYGILFLLYSMCSSWFHCFLLFFYGFICGVEVPFNVGTGKNPDRVATYLDGLTSAKKPQSPCAKLHVQNRKIRVYSDDEICVTCTEGYSAAVANLKWQKSVILD